MRFSDPQYFHLLWLVPALGLLLWTAARRRHRLLSRFATMELTRRLAVPFVPGVRGLRATALLAALTLLIVALARPQYGKQAVILKREGRDIVFLLDTSLSMLADDIKPDRLSRARFEITSLLSRLEGDRVSLVPFAGDAFVLCPLTTDYSALALFMDGVDTDIISQPGTNIARALKVGTEAFDRKEREYRVMILITDGEHGLLFDPENAGMAAAAVERLLDDRDYARQLAENGKRRVIADFNIEKTIDNMIDVYESLVGGGP